MAGFQIERTGVVDIHDGYEPYLRVNQENLIDMMLEAMEKVSAKPKTDFDGRFAGKITITVEFVGDLDCTSEDEKKDGGDEKTDRL